MKELQIINKEDARAELKRMVAEEPWEFVKAIESMIRNSRMGLASEHTVHCIVAEHVHDANGKACKPMGALTGFPMQPVERKDDAANRLSYLAYIAAQEESLSGKRMLERNLRDLT